MTRILNDKSVRELVSVSRDIGKLSAISELIVKKDFPEDALVPVAKEINQYVLALRQTLSNFVDGLDLSLVDDDSDVDYDEQAIGDVLQHSESESGNSDVVFVGDELADDLDARLVAEEESSDDALDLTGDVADSESVLTKDIIDEDAIAEDVSSELAESPDALLGSESDESGLDVDAEVDFSALEESIDEPVSNILDEEDSSSEIFTGKEHSGIDELALQAELDGVGD